MLGFEPELHRKRTIYHHFCFSSSHSLSTKSVKNHCDNIWLVFVLFRTHGNNELSTDFVLLRDIVEHNMFFFNFCEIYAKFYNMLIVWKNDKWKRSNGEIRLYFCDCFILGITSRFKAVFHKLVSWHPLMSWVFCNETN